jgi:ectoine hydroxylase-related dioxygenase (phytanoyl-CoA dioxygenase family)
VLTETTSMATFSTDLGFGIVRGLLERDEAAELHRLVGDVTARIVRTGQASAGRASANERALLREPRLLEVLTRAPLLDTVREAIGEDFQLLAYDSLDTAAGNGSAREWHADFRERVPATLCVNCGIYLQDMTPEVGQLHVVPGSHRWSRGPKADEEGRPLEGEFALDLDAGDCVVFDAQLWHTGSRNDSDRARRAVFAYFGRSWMKRMDAFYETPLPASVTKGDADPVLRQLFGIESPFPSVHGADYNADNPRWR